MGKDVVLKRVVEDPEVHNSEEFLYTDEVEDRDQALGKMEL